MKMQLTAAKLLNADVLMLDEPTGHLDVNNIKWLEDWLEAFPGSRAYLNMVCGSSMGIRGRPGEGLEGLEGLGGDSP